MDFIPDLSFIVDLADTVALWAAAFGSGFWVHKKSAINYKERWRSAVKTLKDEQLQTRELEEVNPKPKEKPVGSPFAAAGNPKEFAHMQALDRLRLEKERLANGLPPKDSMRGNHLYSTIATERIRQGWDWDEDDKGWYWTPTITQRKTKAKQEQEVKSAYSKGYSEGMSMCSSSRYGYDYSPRSRMYEKMMRDAGLKGRRWLE